VRHIWSVTAVNVLPADARVAPLPALPQASHAAVCAATHRLGRTHLFTFLTQLPSLLSLRLGHSRIEPAGAQSIASLKALRELRLYHVLWPHEHVTALGNLTQLVELMLDGVATSAQELRGDVRPLDARALRTLTLLQVLSLMCTPLTPGSVRHVLMLPCLSAVALASVAPARSLQQDNEPASAQPSPTIAELSALEGCDRLERLNIEHMKSEGETGLRLTWLSSLTSLQFVSLPHVPCTDGFGLLAGAVHLRSLSVLSAKGAAASVLATVSVLQSLRTLLMVQCSEITPAWLWHLTPLSGLQWLTIHSRGDKPAQVAGTADSSTEGAHEDASGALDWGSAAATALASAPLRFLDLQMPGLVPSTAVLAGICTATSIHSIRLCTVHPSVDLAPLAQLASLEQLWLSTGAEGKLSTAALQPLTALQHLKDVEVGTFASTPRSLVRTVRSFASIRGLSLLAHGATASHILEHVAAMPHLHELALSNMWTMDALHFEPLRRLPHLELLTLNCSAIDVAVCIAIAGLSQLRVLNLPRAWGTGFTPKAFSKLSTLTGLLQLDVSDNHLLRVPAITNAPGVTDIEWAAEEWGAIAEKWRALLPRCGVLRHLAPLTTLQRASFLGTSVAPSAARVFEQIAGFRSGTLVCTAEPNLWQIIGVGPQPQA
jgi:hypothetical protein